MLGGVIIFTISNSSHEHLDAIESAVFLYCRFSLFLKDPVFFSLSSEVLTGK